MNRTATLPSRSSPTEPTESNTTHKIDRTEPIEPNPPPPRGKLDRAPPQTKPAAPLEFGPTRFQEIDPTKPVEQTNRTTPAKLTNPPSKNSQKFWTDLSNQKEGEPNWTSRTDPANLPCAQFSPRGTYCILRGRRTQEEREVEKGGERMNIYICIYKKQYGGLPGHAFLEFLFREQKDFSREAKFVPYSLQKELKTRALDRINFLSLQIRCVSKDHPIILSGLGTLIG